jgi:hypothetical protein
MVMYYYVLIVFSFRRESLKLILATDPPPPPRWFCHKYYLEIDSKIKALAHSTAPLDCRWYTDANETFVQTLWQKSLNIALSKYLVLLMIIC